MFRPLPLSLLIFALVSFLNYFWPRPYLAEARIYFPGVQPQLYTALTRSLQADPGVSPVPGGNGEVGHMALIILRSQAAQSSAAKGNNQSRRFQVQVEPEEGGVIYLAARSKSAEAAHDVLAGLFEYYSDFVRRTPLTRVAKARADLDQRFEHNVKRLAGLEEELVKSGNPALRGLGAAGLKANPRVMSEMWLRRTDEEQTNRQVLQRLEKLRDKNSRSALPGSDWLKTWAGRRLQPLPIATALKRTPVRRQEFLKQAKLERDYYDALLLHRSLLLQRSFLITWEKLENSNFELLEPISVARDRPSGARALAVGFLCALAAGLLRVGWMRGLRGKL